MSDLFKEKPVRTTADNRFTTKIADGQSGAAATDFLTVAQPGDQITADTNDYAPPILAEETFEASPGDPHTFSLIKLLNGLVKVGIFNGANQMAINADGSVNAVTVAGVTNLPVCSFNVLTPAEDAEASADYVVTSGNTFSGAKVLVGSDYRVLVKIGTWNGTAFTEKYRYYQDPAENRQVCISCLEVLGDGTEAVRVSVTNLDDDDNIDVGVNISGTEVAP